jgi:predicted secreted protein
MTQKPTKTITGAYTTTDADNGYRIICNSATAFEITLHAATGRYNFELEIDNIGAAEVTVNGQTLKQHTHAHVGNNGGAAWSVVAGGGSMSKAEIEAVLTGEISSHTHAANGQYEPVTNGDADSPEILFYNGDVIMAEV